MQIGGGSENLIILGDSKSYLFLKIQGRGFYKKIIL